MEHLLKSEPYHIKQDHLVINKSTQSQTEWLISVKNEKNDQKVLFLGGTKHSAISIKVYCLFFYGWMSLSYIKFTRS